MDLNESYELPDGNVIDLGEELFECTEILFDPSILGQELDGVHRQVYNSVMGCSVDLRRELYSNIFLIGGTTALPGFPERLKEELTSLVPKTINLNVTPSNSPVNAAWIGGSVLAPQLNEYGLWVTKAEYEDAGSQIIHKKCYM